MPGYVQKTLARFAHPIPDHPQHAPSPWPTKAYGAKVQLTAPPDTSDPLPPAEIQRLQEVIGTLLFYTRAIDSTMPVALDTLAAAQTKSTQATATSLTQFLNYCAMHPDTTIRFHASDMILQFDSDASYMSEPKSRSQVASYHYLSTHLGKPVGDNQPPLNGAILVPSNILKPIVASTAEAELVVLFHNGKEAAPLRVTLDKLGWTQPPTPITTDNLTAIGIANDTVKQRCSKAEDM
jgi:hypothetical protein